MIALISEDIANDFERATGIKSVALPKYEKLDLPVSSHADMLICVIKNDIFIYKDYYLKNKHIFNTIPNEYSITLVEKECRREYPQDIALNVLVIGKKIFCNQKHTAKEIIDFAIANGYEIINVKQGYSACSTMVIDEKNAITGDKGMYISLINEGINTLLISSDDIKLNGYDHGFIGGSVGVLNKTMYFFGNAERLKDYKLISNFLDRLNFKIFYVLSGNVCDFGGVKML